MEFQWQRSDLRRQPIRGHQCLNIPRWNASSEAAGEAIKRGLQFVLVRTRNRSQ
jgi:hypothetical protein